MTQESNPNPDVEPNSTPSGSSEPQTVNVKSQPVMDSNSAPQPSKTSAATPTAMDQAQAVAAELWKQAKPVLVKVGTQALLLGNRASDYLLDKGFPLAKEKFIQVLPTDFKTQTQAKIDPVKAKVVPIWQKVWPGIQKTVGPLWARLIALIRAKLPADLSKQLSDRFLNILVVTTFYLVWSFFSGSTHPSQAKTPNSDLTFPEVKNRPSAQPPEKPTLRPTASPSVAPKITSVPAPKAVTPAPKVAVTPPPPAAPIMAPSPQPPVVSQPKVEAPKPVSPKPVTPPQAVTPEPPAPKPLETVKKPEPVTPKPVEKMPVAPKAPIAPVQPIKPVKTGPDLVALKAGLGDAADRVVEDAAALINKVSVNHEQLQVQLGDRWYDLSEKEQTKLAEGLFSQSKKTAYNRLDIRDANNERIARSPYIGDNMIILKRSSSTDTSGSISKD
jgi:hypothetical protein